MYLFGGSRGTLLSLRLGISYFLASKFFHIIHNSPTFHPAPKSPFAWSWPCFKQASVLSLAWILFYLITANPAHAADDYSDAPASYGSPVHLIAGTLKLGANAPDSETTLSPLDGSGDDLTGIDDEDGISFFPALLVGSTSYFIPAMNLSATGTGRLHAWIDFNQDGVFSAAEYQSVAVTAGVLAGSFNWNGITVSATGTTYARFRFTSTVLTDNAGTTTLDERATAAAADGEVEDYAIAIEPNLIPTNYCRSETLVASGNFTTDPVPSSTGWSYSVTPFDTPINGAYNYPTDTNAYHNSNLTGGLYDDFNPAGNPATGIYSALQESDGAAGAVVYKFPHPLLPGRHYYSFDLSSRFNHTVFADQYKISLYNADTDQIVAVLQQDFVDNLPAAAVETPKWRNFNGSFNVTSSANYYLLFQIDQNLGTQNSDYMVDRVVVVAQTCPETDYSDAPSSYGAPTHLVFNNLKLGANAPDSETTLTPLDGSGDDLTGVDDEDGISSFPALLAGATSYSIPTTNITATGTGTLHAWIDFNKNGAFTPGEYRSVTVTNGVLSGPLSWTGIVAGSMGTTYARFRFTSGTLTDNTGTATVDERATSVDAPDGEVEDYAIAITGLDYADAPATYGAPSHIISATLKLGANTPDNENAAQPNVMANGDDTTGIDDEEGIILQPLSPGASSYTLPAENISATGTGTLHAWVDFNKNGIFSDTEYTSVTVNSGVLSSALNWSGITVGAIGTTYARFRFTSGALTDNALTPTVDERASSTNAPDGEVEDYALAIINIDYADAPASYGIPSHAITGSLKLGTNAPDSENAAQPNATATGDDATGIDDEDGISSLPSLVLGISSYSIPAANISATGTGRLHAWIDFNNNGVFTADEYTSVVVTAGTLAGALNWSGITVNTLGTSYLRLRFTSDTLTDTLATTALDERATAYAADGEVEDYALTIINNAYRISGRVFHDSNVNATDDTEAGIPNLGIVLYAQASNTCTVTRTAANGSYAFSNLTAGDYTVYEVATATTADNLSACPPLAQDPNGYQSTTPNTQAVSITNAAVNNVNFGEVKAPIFSLDHEKAILPNTSITYPHRFRSTADGSVFFSVLAEQADPQ